MSKNDKEKIEEITSDDELKKYINKMIEDDGKKNAALAMVQQASGALLVASAILWAYSSYKEDIGLVIFIALASIFLWATSSAIINRVSRIAQHLSAISGMVATSGAYMPVLLSGLAGEINRTIAKRSKAKQEKTED